MLEMAALRLAGMLVRMQMVPCRQAAVGQFASPILQRDLSRRPGRRQWERVCGYSSVLPVTHKFYEVGARLHRLHEMPVDLRMCSRSRCRSIRRLVLGCPTAWSQTDPF